LTDLPSEPEDSIILNYPNPAYSGTMIEFELKENTNATLIIKSQSTGLTVAQNSNFIGAGRNAYQFDNNVEDSNLKFPPGIYTAYLKIKDTVYAKRDFVIDFKFDTTLCEIPKYITKTDANGAFFIPYSWFPDSTYFTRYFDAGDRVGRFLYGGLGKIIVRKRIENPDPSAFTEYKVSIYQLQEINKTKVVDIECKAKSYWVPI
jgi:hypothetical protein